MKDEKLYQGKSKIYQIPTVLGAVVPIYNLAGVTTDLKFTHDILAGIFLGKITTWNDPAIAKINPGVKFPNEAILVVHRAEGSGTTYCFTDYLSKVSPEWNSGPGKGAAPKWPVGLGAKGSEGVAGMVRQSEGSIGYVELIYAVQNNIAYGSMKNAAGKFVKDSLEGVTSASASVISMPPVFRVSNTHPTGKHPLHSAPIP